MNEIVQGSKTFTPDEMRGLIKVIVSYEPWRSVDDAFVEVWTAQAILGRWTYDEAVRAIHLWARDRKQGEFLDPSVVTRTIRADREDRMSREAAPAPFTPMVSEEKARERVAMMAAILAEKGVKLEAGSMDDPTTFDKRGRHVPCVGDPARQAGDRGCGAPVGEPCTLRVSNRRKRTTPSTFVHPSRLVAELDYVNARRRERDMPLLSPSHATPKLPEYARTSRSADE